MLNLFQLLLGFIQEGLKLFKGQIGDFVAPCFVCLFTLRKLFVNGVQSLFLLIIQFIEVPLSDTLVPLVISVFIFDTFPVFVMLIEGFDFILIFFGNLAPLLLVCQAVLQHGVQSLFIAFDTGVGGYLLIRFELRPLFYCQVLTCQAGVAVFTQKRTAVSLFLRVLCLGVFVLPLKNHFVGKGFKHLSLTFFVLRNKAVIVQVELRLLFLITLSHEFYLSLSDVKLGFLSLFNDRLPVFGDLVVSLSRFLGNLFTLPLSVLSGLCGFSRPFFGVFLCFFCCRFVLFLLVVGGGLFVLCCLSVFCAAL